MAKPALYVIANGMASMRTVKTRITNGGTTAVEGINRGDVVATSSFEKLVNGSQVILSKTPLPVTSSESNAP
jgi:multidrug efflux system membrane fusion protein